MPTPMQTYGKIASFNDFYKINSKSDEAQILYGDYRICSNIGTNKK